MCRAVFADGLQIIVVLATFGLFLIENLLNLVRIRKITLWSGLKKLARLYVRVRSEVGRVIFSLCSSHRASVFQSQ